jgi:hypothetical protein
MSPFIRCDPARTGGIECVPAGQTCPVLDGGSLDGDVDAHPPEQPASCVLSSTSTIPGVHIEFPAQDCAFTLARAAQGVVFHYDVVVDEALAGYVSRPSTSGVLHYAGQAIAGLHVDAVITGAGQRYCVCDQGGPGPFCDLPDGGSGFGDWNQTCPPLTVRQGVWHVAWPSLLYDDGPFAWHGRNWDGPSDTLNPEGAPFPPGDYELQVTIAGQLVRDGGTSDVGAEARFLVRLVP